MKLFRQKNGIDKNKVVTIRKNNGDNIIHLKNRNSEFEYHISKATFEKHYEEMSEKKKRLFSASGVRL